MQNLRNHTTTLLSPDVQSQREVYHFSEQLSGSLPGFTGNILLLFRVGVPTPAAGIAFPEAIRDQLKVQLFLDATPGKHFIRHQRPAPSAENVASAGSSEGGPVYRLRLSKLPVPQRHQVFDRIGL